MTERSNETEARPFGEPANRIALAPVTRDQFVLPQFGIFAQGTHAHYFVEFDFKSGVTPQETVTAFRKLRTPDVSAGGVNLVMAFGAAAWSAVAPGLAPADLGSFPAVVGADGRSAPATQHDAWLWISGAEPDVVWQSARAAALAVSQAADLVAEQPGFTYLGGRDITGFIDGTANPQVRRTADVALVPPEQPGEGGSHVIVMRWVHDLTAFERLPLEEQQRVIGAGPMLSTTIPGVFAAGGRPLGFNQALRHRRRRGSLGGPARPRAPRCELLGRL